MADPKLDELGPRVFAAAAVDPMARLREMMGAVGVVNVAPGGGGDGGLKPKRVARAGDPFAIPNAPLPAAAFNLVQGPGQVYSQTQTPSGYPLGANMTVSQRTSTGTPGLGQTQPLPVSRPIQMLAMLSELPNPADSTQWVLDHIARQEPQASALSSVWPNRPPDDPREVVPCEEDEDFVDLPGTQPYARVLSFLSVPMRTFPANVALTAPLSFPGALIDWYWNAHPDRWVRCALDSLERFPGLSDPRLGATYLPLAQLLQVSVNAEMDKDPMKILAYAKAIGGMMDAARKSIDEGVDPRAN